MSDFVLKPKDEELDSESPKADAVQFDHMADEIEGAVRAEGHERVDEAVAEVAVGLARPEALLAWMDDLRDAEEQHVAEDDNLERSFTVDFIPDTARDGGSTDSPPGDEFLFSANRRGYDDDDDGGDGGGGGGGGGGDDGDGAGDGADAPDDDKKNKPKAAKPAKPDPKTPAKPEPPAPPSKGGKGGKPDGK